jgi:excisionase family DNA binding protein
LSLIRQLPKKGYSVAEAAQIMGIGETNVRALIKEKRLRAVRVGEKGRGITIPDFAIDEYFHREAS